MCLFTFFYQRDHLRAENKLESIVSREAVFLFNNYILLLACFTVLWGTLFPVLSEFYDGSKVTMGPPYFNRVMVPIGCCLSLSRVSARCCRGVPHRSARFAATSFCPARLCC